MFHPLRTFRNTVKAVQLTVLNCQRLGYALLTAIERQTAAIQENSSTNAELLTAVKAVEAATEATAKAAQYLAAIEKHRQETAGQRSDFGWLQ